VSLRNASILFVTAALLAACGQSHTLNAGDPFGDAVWQLASGFADGSTVTAIDTAPVTLRVGNGDVTGTSACNTYRGSITIVDDVVGIGDLQVTEMACSPREIMDLEQMYVAALGRVTSVTREGDQLILRGESVELRFTVQAAEPDAPLAGTNWVLDTLVDGGTASTPASPATLLVTEDGTVTGSTGCNTLTGLYDDIDGFTQLATTKKACRGVTMNQEDMVVTVLTANPTLTIAGTTLTIADLDGRALVYRAG
jgi:heat shock protein HslJ